MRHNTAVPRNVRHCEPCNKSFKDEISLDQHLKSAKVHFGDQQHCKSCNKSLKNQTALSQHLESAKAHKRIVPALPQVHPTIYNDPYQPELSRTSIPSGSVALPFVDHGIYETYPEGSSWLFAPKTEVPEVVGLAPIQVLHRVDPDPYHGLLPNPTPSSSITSQSLSNEPYPNKNIPWSIVPDTEIPELFEKLSRKCHASEDLLKHSYFLKPYSASDISGLRKCRKCGRLAKSSENDRCYFHPGQSTSNRQKKGQHCKHCAAGIGAKGCDSNPLHDYQEGKNVHRYQHFAACPSALPEARGFRVLVLDCEMVEVRGAKGLQSEVILVCAVEFFTGAVVLNKLVNPEEKVRDWRTEIHGITSSTMELAISEGRALAGWKEAREELWKLMDENTILVGHALQHDLDVLKMIHTSIVDSAILAKKAVAANRDWGLQKLCKELVGFEIRNNKGRVHDCLEDVLATREVALLCIRDEQHLADWAKVKRVELTREEERRKLARENKRSKRAGAQKQNTGLRSGQDSYYAESGEVEKWMWPG